MAFLLLHNYTDFINLWHDYFYEGNGWFCDYFLCKFLITRVSIKQSDRKRVAEDINDTYLSSYT
ncbi:hypothetical protein, partial [Enterococcus faecalis]|uniref:hypothetical protein n=1 Tax=Enterococcus faecalis TaxID=1351 RepID=UPI000FF6DF48